MSERPHLMQLEAGEDATSVRDRLSFIRGKRVLLVWPEKGTVLTRRLDLVLIQREAMRRAIRLALVTHDTEVIQHATELNISTFSTIGESERKRWKRGRSKVFANRYQKPSDEPDPEDLQAAASRVKQQDIESLARDGITRTILALALIILVLGIGYLVIPSVKITITPARSAETISITITAVSGAGDIDIANRIIPMTQIRVEIVETGTGETTGEIALSDTRAVGTVIFINRTTQEIAIPAGTVVSTSAGTPIQFRTTEPATLPTGTGEQVEVPIEALQDYAGSIGNVDEGLINVVVSSLAGEVEVRNINPTEGGTSETIAAITQNDMERLEATVKQQIQAQAFNEMQPLLTETQFIILETLTIAEERNDWKTFSGNPGDAAETLTLTMRAVVEATAVDEQFGRQIVFASLSNLVPRGRIIQPNTITYSRGSVSEITPDGNVTFEMSANATVIEPVDPNAIQRQLVNRPLDQAFAYLLNEVDSQPGTIPQIEVSPSWIRRMPLLPMRINIDIVEAPL